METEAAFERVRAAIMEVMAESGLEPADIEPHSSLVLDLGFDSMLFVDLALSLALMFGLEEFPLQQWADAEREFAELGFRAESLARYCALLASARSPSDVSRAVTPTG